MRLMVTSDLHFNHARSKPLAEQIIQQINGTDADALLVIGDTAAWDSDALERCLSQISFPGPKLITAGNHEFWTMGADSHEIYHSLLPQRVRNLGWHWLEDQPWIFGDCAVVGSVGWYDYSFAQPDLGIPTRFYEAKVSPGAAERFEEFAPLLDHQHDIPGSAMNVIARWNDGRFVKLHCSDREFLAELLSKLQGQLDALRDKRVLAATHHLPFKELLPPPKRPQWDFAKAYLGSEQIGQLLLSYPNVERVYCGHSHLLMAAKVGHISATTTGCGYRWKQLIVDGMT